MVEHLLAKEGVASSNLVFRSIIVPTCRSGGMADATVSKTVEGNLVWVRLPLPAPAHPLDVR